MADQNFSMKSGDSRSVMVNIVNGSGVAVDLTSTTAVVYKLAESPSGAPLITKELGDGIDVATSVVTVSLAPADTADLAGIYYQELEVTDGDGNIFTVMTGYVGIEADLI